MGFLTVAAVFVKPILTTLLFNLKLLLLLAGFLLPLFLKGIAHFFGGLHPEVRFRLGDIHPFLGDLLLHVAELSFGFGAIGWGGDGAAGGAFNSFSKTPIGRAVIACVNKGVYELVKEVGAQPASGKIVKVDGNQVYVNIGGDSVSAGDTMSVVALGEELVDPETGISLGQTESQVAKLQVAKTTDKFSIATVRSKSGGFGRGDKVVADKAPEPLQFASNWDGPSAGSGGGSGSSGGQADVGR